MNYQCNCDPCTCAAKGQDHASKAAGEGKRPPRESPVSTEDFPVRPSRSARRASRRRVALCMQAGVTLEPPIGAHLITPRRGYTHHGIYAGHGSVLHYAGLVRDFRPGPVEEVPLERFANGQPVHIECRNTQALNDREIVRRARSRLGESRYRLLTNNCEHFSEWSRFGTSRSPQVDRWLGSVPEVTRALVANIGRGLARFRSQGPLAAGA